MYFCMKNYILFASLIIAYNLVLSCNIVHGSTTICSQTLYPELCNSLISAGPETSLDGTTTLNLHRASLQVTLAQASLAHKLVSNMNVSSLNELGMSAWADCVQLYEETIELVNRSISLESSTRSNDAQTWLSAALANQQTCLNGFHDFNLHDGVQTLPIFSNDLSKYISNSLAINKVSALDHATKNVRGRRLLSPGFPEWISGADRKLLQSTSTTTKANIVVAQDGSGSYKTIKEALAVAAKRSGGGRFVIYLKKGVYREQVVISRSMKNFMFVGDGIDQTIVTGSKNVQDGSTTFNSATFAISGVGFIAKDITFENEAGPQKHQAVALRSGSDFSVFYRCSFKGYQDTLYVYTHRQFYRDCNIYGTQDFIFGDGAVVIQNCNIYIRKPMSGQFTTITASGRSDPNENTGIIIQNSRVMKDSQSSKSYLGRPWQKYSRAVFMKCSLGGVIDSAGWLPWSGNFGLSTLYYGEYMNVGASANTGGRVKWPGYHVITSATEAARFSVGNFLGGNSWIPSTGVPFISGL